MGFPFTKAVSILISLSIDEYLIHFRYLKCFGDSKIETKEVWKISWILVVISFFPEFVLQGWTVLFSKAYCNVRDFVVHP